jgi:hypothetical protein
MKSASIYYTIPYLKKVFSRGRIFIQGQNLFTISKYIGFDPEAASSGVIVPPLRTFIAGVHLNL